VLLLRAAVVVGASDALAVVEEIVGVPVLLRVQQTLVVVTVVSANMRHVVALAELEAMQGMTESNTSFLLYFRFV